MFLSSITLGELVRGSRKAKEATKREELRSWIQGPLVQQFDQRVLSFDSAAALFWGQLMGDGDRRGRTPPAIDAQIAAIATVRGLAVVTRNCEDFAELGVEVVDPWRERGG